MNQISPLGWAAVIFVVIITVLVNLALVALLRNMRNPTQIKMPKNNRSSLDLRKAVEILRDPFADERKQLNELSQLVHGTEETNPSPPDQDSQQTKQ